MKVKSKFWLTAMSLIMLPAMSAGAQMTAFADEPANNVAVTCEHEYVDEVTNPTCTEQGYTKHTCSKCGKEYKDSYVDAKGHDYEEIIVEPTCTEQGFTTHYCKTCGYQYSDNYVEPLGHNYTDVVFAPTCTEDGYTIHKCEKCKHEYKDNYVPAIGHEYEEVVTEATCGKGGYTTYTCKHCGDSYVANETPAKGHNHVEKIVKATCVSYGYTEHLCECGDRYVTNYVKPLGHDYETVIVPATQDKTGYTKHTCRNCGQTYLSDFVDSGDGGYIPEPVEPPAHVHNYVLTTMVDRLNKTITLEFDCLCGESGVDLLTVLFTDNLGDIKSEKPMEGVVDYSAYNGQYDVSVIDTKGNVLKNFSVGKTETDVPVNPDIPDIPVNPDNPDIPIEPEQHTHNFELKTDFNKATGILKIEYKCPDCNEVSTNTLTVIVTDSEGNGMVCETNENGEYDFSKVNGEYTVTINNDAGKVIKEIKCTNEIVPVEPETPDNSNDSNEKEEPTEKQNSATGPILIGVSVLLIAGAVTVIILMKKKGKNKKTK